MKTDVRLWVVLLLTCFCFHAKAQQTPFFDSQKETIKIIRNKFRTNLPRYIDFHIKNPDAQRMRSGQEETSFGFRSSEIAINDTPEAESELHAAINPVDSNNIIVAAMRNDPQNFLAPLSFPIYYTQDFGETWQKSDFDGVPSGDLLAGGGDPVVVFDSRGWAHLTYLTVTLGFPDLKATMALRYAYSKDGGASWTSGENFVDEGGIDPLDPLSSERLIDKEWLAIDRSDLSSKDDIYMIYVEMIPDTLENVDSQILVKRKPADALEFDETTSRVNTNDYILVQFSSIAVDKEGVVHAFFMGISPDETTAFYHAKSSDGGLSFTPETKISDFHLPGLAPDEPSNIVVGIDSARIYPCPHMRVDNSGGPNEGNLYAVWTSNGTSAKATPGVDIYFTKSTDGGESWAVPTVLNDDIDPSSHQFYPSLHVNEQGTVIVSWYDRRDDDNNINTHYYMTYSTDGGESFEPNFAVSTATSDFTAIGDKNGGFGIGEYTQVIASSAYAIPVWSDGRNNDGNIDLFVAFVPLYDQALGFDQLSTISPEFSVRGPHPNPVSGEAILKLNLQQSSVIELEVHRLDGQLVQKYAPYNFPSGESELRVETHNLSDGIYTVTIRTDFGYLAKKMIVTGE